MIIRLEQLNQFKSELLSLLYQKPAGGIPSTDLADGVQALLNKADTALQASDLQTLNGKVAALEQLIADDENSPTAAIDKFNEIVTFLANITNTETMEGILSGINSAISAKYTKPAGGIPRSDLAESYKTTQEAVQDPAADGTGITFIDRLTQDTNGVVTPHKKTVQNASTSAAGLMSPTHFDKVEALVYASNADILALFN